jgi:hypothetical protein
VTIKQALNDPTRKAILMAIEFIGGNSQMHSRPDVVHALDEALRSQTAAEVAPVTDAECASALKALDRQISVKEPEKIVFCKVSDLFNMRDEQTLRRALSRQSVPALIPDGWQLVPKIPTPEMSANVFRTQRKQNEFHAGMGGRGTSVFGTDEDVYKAMLAAAPQPPSTPEANSTKAGT